MSDQHEYNEILGVNVTYNNTGHENGIWKTSALAYNCNSAFHKKHEGLKFQIGTTNSLSTEGNFKGIRRSNPPRKRSASGKGHHTQNKWRRYVLAAAAVGAVFILIFVAFTPLWLFHKDKPDETGERLTEYEVNLTVSNQEHVQAMSDTSSDEFIGTAVTFCESVDDIISNSNLSNKYKGCLVTQLRYGSLKVTFILAVVIQTGETNLIIDRMRILLANGKTGEESANIATFQFKAHSLILSVKEGSDSILSVRCLQQPSILHAAIQTQSGNSYGDVITVRCVDGYAMNGNSILKCRVSNSWGILPSCSVVMCPSVVSPANSIMNNDQPFDLSFNSTVNISCIDGFILKGHPEITCQSNATWSSLPKCNPITCINFTIPSNGNINASSASGHIYRSVLKIECNEGFELKSEEYSTCLYNGNWSNTVTCNSIICVDFIPTQFSYIKNNTSGTNRTFDSQLKIQCISGYEIDGNEQITTKCKSDQTWSFVPECKPLNCGEPMWSKNILVPDLVNTTFNKTITFTCQDGFILNGSSEITCTVNGTWSKMAVCQPKNCGEFLNITYGTVTKSDGTYVGDQVVYECNLGYVLKNLSKITCEESGNWSVYPECLPISCPDFHVVKGNVTGDGQMFNDEKQVICNDGFQINGSIIVTCNANGLWSESPECMPRSCDKTITPPTNGYILQNLTLDFSYGQAIIVHCNEGFLLQPDTNVSCKADGNWSDVPNCVPIACTPFIYPANSTYQIESNTTHYFNDSITIICQANYGIHGENVTCQSNGTWTESPTCEPVQCMHIQPPENGRWQSTVQDIYLVGDELSVACSVGFELSESIKVTCLRNESWSLLPTCTRKKCNTLTIPNNSTALEGNTTDSYYGDEIQLKCRNGYDLSGHHVVTCLANATWSPRPKCNIVTCDDIPSLENGFKTVGEYSNPPQFGERVILNCSKGYLMVGNSTIVCQADRSWGPQPVCEVVRCPSRAEIEHGFVNLSLSDDRKFGDTTDPVCTNGYKQNESVLCTSEGVWEGDNACKMIDCGILDITIANGEFVNKTGTTYDSSALFKCNNGFLISGENPIYCGQDEQWQDKPECKQTLCESFETPANSYVTVKNESYIEVLCEQGYELNGSSSVFCNSSGKWSSVPQCILATCGKLTETPLHGSKFNSTGVSIGDHAWFVCDKGYMIEGNAEVRCLQSGKWEALPTCVLVDCGRPEAPAFGSFDEPFNTQVNSTVEIKCIEGYAPLNNQSSTTCLESGSWNVVINCVPVECPLLDIDHGVVISYSDETKYNSIANVECVNGYQLEQTKISKPRCNASALWDEHVECSIIDCGILTQPEHSKLEAYANTSFGTIVEASCISGYTLKGDSFTKCGEDGQWTDGIICQIVDCGKVASHPETRVITSATTYGSNAIVSCETNGVTNFIVCSSQGIWMYYDSNKTYFGLNCNEVSVNCKFPQYVENGQLVNATGIQSMDTFGVECNTGFDLEGKAVVVCGLDGNWSEYPKCNIVDCGDPIPPVNAKAFPPGYTTYGSWVEIACLDGYTSVSNNSMECLVNGSWSAANGCIIVCIEFLVPDTMIVVSQNGTSLGSTITVSCEDGFYLFDPAEESVRCSEIGVWSGNPVCIDAAPEDPYLHCIDGNKTATYGSNVVFICRIRNIESVIHIAIQQNDVTPRTFSAPIQHLQMEVNNGVTFNLTGAELILNIPVDCVNEGSFNISINDVVHDVIYLKSVLSPSNAQIFGPSTAFLGQLTDITCSGNLGNNEYGEALASLIFEYKLQNQTEFVRSPETEYINDSSNRGCLNLRSWRLPLYPVEYFNNSKFRCSLFNNNELLSSSYTYTMILRPPSIYFVNVSQSMSVFIGDPLHLLCVVENTPDFKNMTIHHNDEILNTIDMIGNLEINITSVECNDKGFYRCVTTTDDGTSISTVVNITIKRKPVLPEFHLSLEIIEDQSPWADFPTTCSADLGYPMGTLQLETNMDGTFKTMNVSVDYTNNDDECSSNGRIRYFNTYNMSWDDTTMKCTAGNNHILDYNYTLAVSRTVQVLPGTFCDDKDWNKPIEHPYACRAQLTCADVKIIPFAICKFDECYNRVSTFCENCTESNRCPNFTSSGPTILNTTEGPKPHVIDCPQESYGKKGDKVTITCNLTDVVVDLNTLEAFPVVLKSETDVLLNTSNDSLTSQGSGKKTFIVNDEITVDVMESSVTVTLILNNCNLEAYYTIQYTSSELHVGTIKLVIHADATIPILVKTHSEFYRNQVMEITCIGDVGNPPSEIKLSFIGSHGLGNPTLIPTITNSSRSDSNCGNTSTLKYSFYVRENMNGSTLYCQTRIDDENILLSSVEDLVVSDPVASFGDETETIVIGDGFEMACSWRSPFGVTTVTIRRRNLFINKSEEVVRMNTSVDLTKRPDITAYTIINAVNSSLVVKFTAMSCEDEGEYTCDLMQHNDDIAFRVRKFAYVTDEPNQPVLKLPNRLVVDSPTPYDSDFLNCNANIGYRKNINIRFEYFSETTSKFKTFDLGTAKVPLNTTEDCATKLTIRREVITFAARWNNTRMRCVIYNTDTETMVMSSVEQKVQLIENHCTGTNDDTYQCHPYNRRLYTRCQRKGYLYVLNCFDQCANIVNIPTQYAECVHCWVPGTC